MGKFKYIIVGGGMTADSAVAGISELDRTGTIALFSEEGDPPYNRPPLSKGLWKGDPPESILRKSTQGRAELFLSTKVVSIDAKAKSVQTGEGVTHNYESLLLATGGSPRRLPFGGDTVIYFRTAEDYRRLKSFTDTKNQFVVIGGGFIGSEIAAGLAMNEKKVTMLFPEDGVASRVFPQPLAAFITDYYRQKGVRVLNKESVTGIGSVGDRHSVKTNSGEEVSADAVVAGLGIKPNDELAKSLGLETADGIVVDEYLRTSDRNIYAAGDVANFFSKSLQMRRRVEHEDNALTMGMIAGHNMAGQNETYNHLPFFYSDMFDLGYEAVGVLDSRLQVVEDWEEKFHKGVLYYLDSGKLKGVLLWNTWGKVDAARELINSGKIVQPESLKGRIKD